MLLDVTFCIYQAKKSSRVNISMLFKAKKIYIPDFFPLVYNTWVWKPSDFARGIRCCGSHTLLRIPQAAGTTFFLVMIKIFIKSMPDFFSV